MPYNNISSSIIIIINNGAAILGTKTNANLRCNKKEFHMHRVRLGHTPTRTHTYTQMRTACDSKRKIQMTLKCLVDVLVCSFIRIPFAFIIHS